MLVGHWFDEEGVMHTVVLAVGNLIVREGLAQMLAFADDIAVIATCEDRESALRVIGETPPDVVVTDVRMPPADTSEGLDLATSLRDSHPHIGVVVLISSF